MDNEIIKTFKALNEVSCVNFATICSLLVQKGIVTSEEIFATRERIKSDARKRLAAKVREQDE
jgi:hypothetical protein